MLASIFSKVTGSLGKSFVFAGLMPSAAFLVYFAWYFGAAPSPGALLSILGDPDSWKPFALDAAVWIGIGFLFYSARPLVFSFFHRPPTGRIDRRRVFRRVRQRARAQRALEEIELRATALVWLTSLDLDRMKTSEIPHWAFCAEPQQALETSRRGREALVSVDRSVGDALSLTVSACDAIAAGIFALYLLAARRRKSDTDTMVETECRAWRSAAGSDPAKDILACVEQDLKRRFTGAFLKREQFGEGAYIFPTELGNRISALDDYAQDRYGIDTATIWDRIWWVLPDEVKGEVGDARLALETLINLALALLLAAVTLFVMEIASCRTSFGLIGPSCNAPRLILFVAPAFLTSLLIYRGAVFAMQILSIKTTTLVDMYRLPMLKQLGFEPSTVGEERALYVELKGFFTQSAELEPTRKLALGGKPEAASKPGKVVENDPPELQDG